MPTNVATTYPIELAVGDLGARQSDADRRESTRCSCRGFTVAYGRSWP
jgi:hypothetical protein